MSFKLPKNFGTVHHRVQDLEDTAQPRVYRSDTSPEEENGIEGDEVIVEDRDGDQLFKFLNGNWVKIQKEKIK